MHYESKLAGQEGLEPPTCGFGDRRSTNWSYWPIVILASLFMNGMRFAPLAILLVFNTLWVGLLILFGRIITALAFGAGQGDQRTH